MAIRLTRHQKYLVASGQLSKLPANCLSERERWAFDINWHKRKAASMDNARSRVGLVPKLERPYSRLLAAIRAGERKFDQRTLCTAGHLVNLAGDEGRALAEKFGVSRAAMLLHEAAHPGTPCQNFGFMPDDLALAYIETMAEREAEQAKGITT